MTPVRAKGFWKNSTRILIDDDASGEKEILSFCVKSVIMSRRGGIRVLTLARDGDDVSVTDRSDISLPMTRSRSPQDTLDAIVVALRGSSAPASMPSCPSCARCAPRQAAPSTRRFPRRPQLWTPRGVVLDGDLDALFRALDAGPEGRGTGALSSQTASLTPFEAGRGRRSTNPCPSHLSQYSQPA